MDGSANYYGIVCDSGHKAVLGVQFIITNVWRKTRPTPEEFKEIIEKARERLKDDKLWDNILHNLYENDRKERFFYKARKVRGYKIPCPRCGAENSIIWENFRWDRNPEVDPELHGWYLCGKCGQAASEAEWKDNFSKATFPETETTRKEAREKMVIDPECFLGRWPEMRQAWQPCDLGTKENAVEVWKDRYVCNGVYGICCE